MPEAFLTFKVASGNGPTGPAPTDVGSRATNLTKLRHPQFIEDCAREKDHECQGVSGTSANISIVIGQ